MSLPYHRATQRKKTNVQKPKNYASTLYYNGTGYFSETSNRKGVELSKDQLSNLKRGGSSNCGKWGAKSGRIFKSRALYMIDHAVKPCYTLILTYRNNPGGHQVAKANLNAFLQYMRRRGCVNYVWTLELTKRGLLHYHLIVEAPYFKDEYKVDKTTGEILETIPGTEVVNLAWCNIRGDYSKGAVRGIKKVRGSKDTVNYFAKGGAVAAVSYISKMQAESVTEDVHFLTRFRLWAASKNLIGKEKLSSSEHQTMFELIFKGKQTKSIEVRPGFFIHQVYFERDKLREAWQTLLFFREREDEKQRKQRENKEKIAKNKALRARVMLLDL